MTVQDIINAVSIDTRKVLANSGSDATTITGWVDRVHKDVLHSSLYVNQNLGVTSLTTTIGTGSYTLSPSNIRRIVSVYDTTFGFTLTPSDAERDQPSPIQARVDESQGRPFSTSIVPSPNQVYRFGNTPEYYRFIGPTTLVVRPAPGTSSYISTLNITYEQQVVTLASTSTTLLIPDDGLDVVVAGVNWMAMAYIGRPQEAMSWFQLYQQLKGGDRVGVIR